MKKIILLLLFLCVILLCKNIFITSIPTEVSLDSILDTNNISLDAKFIKLKRGKYTYTLQKEKDLNAAQYIVESMYPYAAKGGGLSPADAYVGIYFVVQADADTKEFTELMRKGTIDIEVTSENKTKIKRILEASRKYNKSGFSATILPANNIIKNAAEKIKRGDIITITGILFKHISRDYDGHKELSRCQKNTKVFYVTNLKISKRDKVE